MITQQFCLSQDLESFACFLEVVTQGRSQLFTTAEHEAELILNEQRALFNAEFIVVSNDEYAYEIEHWQPNSIILTPNRLDILDYANARACSSKSGGWWADWGRCAVGVTAGYAGGFVIGSSGGPIGAAVGGLFGGMAGAGQFCSLQMFVHFEDYVYEISESRARDHLLIRCI